MCVCVCGGVCGGVGGWVGVCRRGGSVGVCRGQSMTRISCLITAEIWTPVSILTGWMVRWTE